MPWKLYTNYEMTAFHHIGLNGCNLATADIWIMSASTLESNFEHLHCWNTPGSRDVSNVQNPYGIQFEWLAKKDPCNKI